MDNAITLRIARPSDDLDGLLAFYRDGLGLELLFRFEDHEGFDGVMLGSPGAAYHFEFTRAKGHPAGRAPTQDNLVVFYIADEERWRDAVERMRGAGFAPVASFNPYWDRQGRTFEDPDGYRVVLQQGSFRPERGAAVDPQLFHPHCWPLFCSVSQALSGAK
jgi:catechol 2,3-dioxygenase-like lactoylglutathione lyase family enzyme